MKVDSVKRLWAPGGRLFSLAHSSNLFFLGAVAGAAILTALFALAVGYRVGGSTVATAVDDYGEAAAALIAAVACAVAACWTRERIRAAWLLLGLAATSWCAGQSVWTYYEVVLNQQVPNPSPADIGFLGMVPLGFAGLLLLVVPARRRSERARALVDSLLIAASLLFVSWQTVLGPIFLASALSPVAKLVTLAYPVGDVAMLTIVAFALTRVSAASRAPLALLGAGFVALSISDTVYAYLSATSDYAGSTFDTGWFAGFLLIALASLRSLPMTAGLEGDSRLPGRVRMAIPSFAFGLALLTGGVVIVGGGRLSRASLGIGVTIAFLTLVSQLLALFENRALLARSLADERALRESQVALEEVIASAPVALFSLDPEGVITLATGHGLDRFRPGSNKLLGSSTRELLATMPDALAVFDAALAGTPGHIVATFPSGQLDIRLMPVLEGARVVSVSGVAVDVSDRREAEIAQRENEAKSRFLATMSHELRTPLNSVLGFAELLLGERRGPLNDHQKRYVVNISESGQHLLALINDVLDLSRVAAGQIEVVIQKVSLEEAIEDVTGKVRPLVDGKELRLEIDGTESITILADRTRLRQVILNLLSNAIKFTPNRGRVAVRARRVHGWVEVEVEDSGIGIAPENHGRIFEEYSQVHVEGSRAQGGTGLGLTVSRRLAELMGGSLSVSSQLGVGSVFTLRLPAGPAALGPAGGIARRGSRRRPVAAGATPADD